MKNLLLIIATLLFVFGTNSIRAQNWNSEELEIIKRVEIGWSSWQEAVNQKDLSIWLNAVNLTDDWKCWWTEDGALWDVADTKRNFELFSKDVKKYYWMNVNPLSVEVHGDVAFIWFYALFTIEDINGKTTTTEDKRFEVYRKIDGKWRWSAGMVKSKETD